MKELLDLFYAFAIIGITTFGGGYAMLPVIERELIKKRNWINIDEVMDYFTIAQITPGIIMVNVATFVGYKRRGIAGGIIATIGIILPGMCLMLLISIFLTRFAEYPLVHNAFAGIRIAVAALVLNTILNLTRGFFKNYKTLIVFIMAFILSAVFSTSPVIIILGAGFAGFIFFPARQQKDNDQTKQDNNP